MPCHSNMVSRRNTYFGPSIGAMHSGIPINYIQQTHCVRCCTMNSMIVWYTVCQWHTGRQRANSCHHKIIIFPWIEYQTIGTNFVGEWFHRFHRKHTHTIRLYEFIIHLSGRKLYTNKVMNFSFVNRNYWVVSLSLSLSLYMSVSMHGPKSDNLVE